MNGVGLGPVPWRKEIEDGIRSSAKVVMLVDKAYLLSFNCVQEVAFAIEFSKPIVIIILEQAAMELLTRPHGVDEAWAALQPFEDKLLLPGVAQQCISHLFALLHSDQRIYWHAGLLVEVGSISLYLLQALATAVR